MRWWLLGALCWGACSGDDKEPDDTDDTDVVGETDDVSDTEVESDEESDEPEQEACHEVHRVPDGEGGCRPVRVLLLDDRYDVEAPDSSTPGSGDSIRALLGEPFDGEDESAFEVTEGGPYYQWDGTIPAGTDVIFWAQGVVYGQSLTEGGVTALSAFVGAGGGLVRTEWGAAYSGIEPDVCPVESAGGYAEGVMAWTEAEDAPAVLTAGVPTSFSITHGAVAVREKEDLAALNGGPMVVAFEVQFPLPGGVTPQVEPVPGLVLWPGKSGRGTIGWVNHDLDYQDAEALQPVEIRAALRNLTWAVTPNVWQP